MALKKSELYSSLWASCDELRGGMDASQYKDYVLVLLFVKYVSDRYADEPYALVALKGEAQRDAASSLLRHWETVDAGHRVRGMTGQIEQDGADCAPILRAVHDAGEHQDCTNRLKRDSKPDRRARARITRIGPRRLHRSGDARTHGFTIEQMVELVHAGLASVSSERVAAGRHRVKITDEERAKAGRIVHG
jgi:hypothetical protein